VHFLQSWRSLPGSKTKATTALDLYLHLFVCFSSGSSGSSCFFLFLFSVLLVVPFLSSLSSPSSRYSLVFSFPSPFLFLSSLSSASLRSPSVYLSFRSFQKISHPLFLSPYAAQFSFLLVLFSMFSPCSLLLPLLGSVFFCCFYRSGKALCW